MHQSSDNTHDYDHTKSVGHDAILSVLQQSLETENDLMRTYLITADQIHHDEILKERLSNFAEGNAKRAKQLIDEIQKLQ